MTIHEDILAAVAAYTEESAKFEEKGVKAAATRARSALGDLAKACKARRLEIQTKKNAMSTK